MSNTLMTRMLWVLAIVILLPSATLLTAGSGLPWTTDYKEALQRSKAEGKPLFLFFTGSDWCSWCTRLESEVLETQGFIEKAKDKYIFVELDYPQGKAQPAALKAQNKQLQEKYSIRGYPAVIIADSEGNKLAQTGYEAGGGKLYAAQLEKKVGPYLAKFAKAENKAVASAVRVEAVTQENVEIQLIALKGMTTSSREKTLNDEVAKANPDQNLLRAGYLIVADGKAIREKLLAQDPAHQNGTEYFLSMADHLKKGEALEPLIAFAEKVGERDKANLWKVEWTIAKGYLKAGNTADAMKWAEKSIAHAPEPSKPEVQTWISSFKSEPQQEKVALESRVEEL